MGLFIFILWVLIESALIAGLFAWDDWFYEHDKLETFCVYVACTLALPFIVPGVIFFELFEAIRNK